jgi:hypothetical protein
MEFSICSPRSLASSPGDAILATIDFTLGALPTGSAVTHTAQNAEILISSESPESMSNMEPCFR